MRSQSSWVEQREPSLKKNWYHWESLKVIDLDDVSVQERACFYVT